MRKYLSERRVAGNFLSSWAFVHRANDRRWFDCAECHAEVSDHPLLKSNVMTMICKKCKKAFRKDVADMESPDEADEYCPHCDNHFLREAVTKDGVMGLAGQSTTEDLRKQQYAHVVYLLIIELFGIIDCRELEYSLLLKRSQIQQED